MKGFHQNVVEFNSRKYLRIISHLGIHEYLKMPFGIKNAPAFFQRMMDTEFNGELREGWIIVFMDDVIIFHDNWEDHIAGLAKVMNKMKNLNMTVSLDKCNFGFNEVRALGHIVSGLTLAIDQNKVAAVLHKPLPTTIKEVQSFLGLASYYRIFLVHFATVTHSLYHLLKKGVEFNITEERAKAWETVKKMLTEAPCLLQPDFTKPLILYVDASFFGLGAALH